MAIALSSAASALPIAMLYDLEAFAFAPRAVA